MKVNLHAHTSRCNHAFGSEREYVEEAIRCNMTDFGFSDHTPMIYPEDFPYPSSVKMKMSEMEDYTETILNLREEYKDRINIYLGLEVEYYPKLFYKTLRELEKYPLEYFIMGQHHLENEYDGVWVGIKTDDEKRLKRYVDQVCEGLSTGYFLYLAHPDILNFVGDDKAYIREMTRLCEYTKENDIPLEINLLGLADKRNYPNELFWELAGKIGNDVIIGLDVHRVSMIDVKETENKALDMVEKYNLKLIRNPAEKLVMGKTMWEEKNGYSK
ncbi:MAG: histidinol-phosphatase [Lachnospiraceae bacterium]|nr:histidinol-phosphatase [Lachnospiraceae bacterium]